MNASPDQDHPRGSRNDEIKASMPSQRIILGSGLAILLLIGAASVGLDLKSRSDMDSLDRANEVLRRISDLRPLLRSAESAARGFALTGDPEFVKEFQGSSDAILPRLEDVIKTAKASASPRDTQLLEETRTL